MTVKIRKANGQDLEALVVLASEYGAEQEQATGGFNRLAEFHRDVLRQMFMEGLQTNTVHMAVAEGGEGDLVGYALVQFSDPPLLFVPQPFGFVTDLFVRPSHRRQGVGRGLLDDARIWCLLKGADRMSVVVPHGGAGAQLAIQAGFRPLQQLLVWDAPPVKPPASGRD